MQQCDYDIVLTINLFVFSSTADAVLTMLCLSCYYCIFRHFLQTTSLMTFITITCQHIVRNCVGHCHEVSTCKMFQRMKLWCGLISQIPHAPVPYPTITHIGTEMYTFLFQYGLLWDMGQMHYGICEIDVSINRDTLLQSITITSCWTRRRLKSPASRLFTQPFNQAQITEKIKALRH